MLLNLIKKDILLAKKFVFVSMLLVVAIPLFIMYAAPSASSFTYFLYMVILEGIILLQVISQEEGKYPKAIALLCATPYRRSSIVKAKYVFFLMMFAYCYIVYTLVMLIINPAKLLDLTTILAVLLISLLIYSVYIPIEFKYGFVKAKFLFMITILLFSTGPTLFRNLLAGINLEAFATLPPYINNIVLASSSVVILGISMMISIRIFLRKEL